MAQETTTLDRAALGIIGIAIFAVYIAIPPATDGAITEQAFVWFSLIVAGLCILTALQPVLSDADKEVQDR